MRLSLALTIASVAISIQASAQTLPSSTSTACSRFKPGHYVHITSADALRYFLSKDVRNFRGVHYQMNWGMIEKSPGVYDFSGLDAALAQVKAKNMYLQLFFKERTFHGGCQSQFVPSYVPKEGSYQGASICYAKIWEKTTMDHMIRVLQQIALRYKDHPNFLGISLPETSVAALSMKANWSTFLALYAQLKRAYQALNSVAPNLIVHQMMNWPYPDARSFYDLATNLAETGAGGAMGWPDSVPAKTTDKNWSWYQVGRDYNKKLAVIPHVQTPLVGSSRKETEQIYSFLNDDIKAHMIVWSIWHKDMGGAYFTDVVIPTVNAHGGAVKNTLCPW